MIRRIELWYWPLQQVLMDYDEVLAVYGKTDCCCFVTACVKAMTGFDLMSAFEMKYTTAAGALKELIKFGGVNTPEGLMDRSFSTRLEVSYAGRGDVISKTVDKEDAAVGICLGKESAFVHMSLGLVQVPTTTCNRAWRV